MDGSSFDLQAERGSVVVVNFWASWCEPCRQEMPAFDDYLHRHAGDGLKIVGISMDDKADDDAARKVIAKVAYPAAFEREMDYDGYGRIWRLPMTFVIGRDGRLRHDGSKGDPTFDARRLDEIVTPLLRSTDAPP